MRCEASGRCLCGAISYQISGPMEDVIACHCKQCRQTSGHHVAATRCAREHLAISGTPVWFESSPGHRRGFCGVCGSNLFWENFERPTVSIMAGTLDDPTKLRIKEHIFVEDKADYYDVPEALA